jgi:drug/metabolite transporter (DMT)-like permease
MERRRALSPGRPRADLVGVAFAATGAVGYGVTVVVGRDLATTGIGAASALALRFAMASALLLVFLRVRGVRVTPNRDELPKVLLLGAVGYAVESALFYAALERGTAAATAIVFYSYPVFVTLMELARGTERPERRTALALGASVAGTAVVVAAGNDVAFSATGVVFTLAAAVTFAVYLLVARELGRRTEAMTMACWVSIGSGASQIVRAVVTGTVHVPTDRALELLLYGGASAAAFAFSYAAMQHISAARVAVVMTLEALSAVVLGAVFLGEAVRPVQLLGGLLVLSAAAVIGAGRATTERAVESAP